MMIIRSGTYEISQSGLWDSVSRYAYLSFAVCRPKLSLFKNAFEPFTLLAKIAIEREELLSYGRKMVWSDGNELMSTLESTLQKSLELTMDYIQLFLFSGSLRNRIEINSKFEIMKFFR